MKAVLIIHHTFPFSLFYDKVPAEVEYNEQYQSQHLQVLSQSESFENHIC